MPKTITGADAFNDEVSVPTTGDPGAASGPEAIAQRGLDNTVWLASRLAENHVVVSLTETAVNDASSAYGTTDDTSSTTFVASGTYSQTVTTQADDVVVAWWCGSIQCTDTAPGFGEVRLVMDSDAGPHQRVLGGTYANASLIETKIATTTTMRVEVQIREDAVSGAMRILGSGRLITAVLRPIPDPI